MRRSDILDASVQRNMFNKLISTLQKARVNAFALLNIRQGTSTL